MVAWSVAALPSECTATAHLRATQVKGSNTASAVTNDLVGTRFYSLGGATVATRTADQLSLLFGDEQGSAQVMMQVTLDATGAMAPAAVTDPITRNAYTPYGAVRGADQLPTEHGWLNKIADTDTGLTYLGARYYDPLASRFISPDPLMNPMDPRTLDAFMYANNNPILFSDPTGLTPRWDPNTGTLGKDDFYADGSYLKTKLSMTPTNDVTSAWIRQAAAQKQGKASPSVLQVFGAIGTGGGKALWNTVWATAIEPSGLVQGARFAASPSYYFREKWEQAAAQRSAWWSGTKSGWSFVTGGGQTWVGHWKQVDQDFTGGVFQGDDALEKWQTGAEIGTYVAISVVGPKVVRGIGARSGVAANTGGLASATGFADGGLFEATIASRAGNVQVLAETSINGGTLTLSDVAIYGQGGPMVGQVGAGSLLQARSAVAQMAADSGFDVLRITGVRVPGSSALKPGTVVDYSIDLAPYK